MVMDLSEDVNDIERALYDIRDQLLAQNKSGTKDARLQTSIKQLSETATPQIVMDRLAPLLFLPSDDSNSDIPETATASISPSDALNLVGVLVTAQPSIYLKPASRAVKQCTEQWDRDNQTMKVVSPELRTIMIQQLSSPDVEVSANATDAILASARHLGRSWVEPTAQHMVHEWKLVLAEKTNASSVLGVRFASAMCQLMVAEDGFCQIGLAAGAGDLLVQMLTYDADPLLQMSVLELLETTMGGGSAASDNNNTLAAATSNDGDVMHPTRARWLFSPAITQPLLAMAGGLENNTEPDPILGGPALRVVGALCKSSQKYFQMLENGESMDEGNDDDNDNKFRLLTGFHRALHQFAALQSNDELDRLALVDAVSSFSSASPQALELVLNDPVTRDSWLSLSGVAQPKLKAVILTSVAQVFSALQSIHLYTMLGRTNDTETSQLLLSVAQSPLPELRIAAYTVLEALAKLENAAVGASTLLASFCSGSGWESMLQRDPTRAPNVETTKEGREAKYVLIQAIAANQPLRGLLAEGIVRQLDDYVRQGPHYQKVSTWEVATQ